MSAGRCVRLALLLGLAWRGVALPAQSPAAKPASGRWSSGDTQRFQDVRDVRISPDGKWVAFEVARTDLARNGRHSAIAVVPADGGVTRVLTAAGADESTPRWSPDGRRLAFLVSRGDTTQLWTMDAEGKARRRVTTIESSNQRFGDEEDGESFAWSPDGKQFVFTGVDPTARRADRDPLVVSRFMFQAYSDYHDGRITQLWLVSADGGAPRRLSDGQHVDLAPAWSPDGREIVFVSNHEADPDFHRNDDLFVVDVATGHVRQLTTTDGSEVRPSWSPDGKWIAYLATTRKWATYDSMAEDFHAWVIPAAGGPAHELNGTLDRRTASVAWLPDAHAVLFTAQDRGRVVPYTVPLEGGESRPLIDRDVSVGEPTIAATGRLAFSLATTVHPSEAAVLDAGAAAPHVVTTVNDAVVAALTTRPAETLWFPTTENTQVQGWLMAPADTTSGHVPLVLFIHGGPHGAFGYRFSAEHQMYAARGYAVLYINPRGSSAYGQRFSDACIGNWGGVDYADLMMGVDYVLRTHPWLDASRMVVTGGSYGGFMTNWVVTHTTRFRAAVTREGMSNLMTDQSLSDAWDLEMIEFGPPRLARDRYLRWSPISYVENAETPTLIIHGDRDHDVTFAEAAQMFAALKLQGVETQLLVYPREPHGFEEPRHIVDAYDRMLGWFDAHLAGIQTVDQRWDADRRAVQWSGDAPGRATQQP